MLSSLIGYPLVYVGELHDNPASHRLQVEILKAMQASHPGKVALGMEMFNNEQQVALDRWVAGELSEKSQTPEVLIELIRQPGPMICSGVCFLPFIPRTPFLGPDGVKCV